MKKTHLNVLMLVLHYEPDLGPSAPLFTMLSAGLAQRGHKVTVITTVPHYPSGKVSISYRGLRIRKSIEKGVEVIRVPIPSLKRSNLLKRLLQFISFQIYATCIGMKLHYDVAIVSNPALTVWLPFAFHNVLRKRPSIFSVHDVYPDVGISLGVFRHRPVIKAVAKLERFCLNRCSIVRILSDSFRPGLRALGVPDRKMALVYDWVDTDLIRPLCHDNWFAEQLHLDGRFVVLYAGNLGLSQGLEHLLTAAEKLAEHKDIAFVLIGDGAARERLVSQAEQCKLSNVKFLPFQQRDRLSEVLAIADVSVVMLRRGIGTDSLPSKTFSILASGRPVLACLDESSQTWKLVKRAGAGLHVPPENPSELVRAILALKQNKDLRERLGINGRKWAEKYHSPQSAAEQFEKLLSLAAEDGTME